MPGARRILTDYGGGMGRVGACPGEPNIVRAILGSMGVTERGLIRQPDDGLGIVSGGQSNALTIAVFSHLPRQIDAPGVQHHDVSADAQTLLLFTSTGYRSTIG